MWRDLNMHARIRIIRFPVHGVPPEKAGTWLEDKMIDHARKEFAEIVAEEPNAGWRLQVCGDLGNWHDFSETDYNGQYYEDARPACW
jgi:hypothetical protein